MPTIFISGNGEITGEDVTDDIDKDLPLGPIAESKFHDGDQRLPVYIRGLSKGMNTDDAADILLKLFADCTLMATCVPKNISKNTVFVVDMSNLSN